MGDLTSPVQAARNATLVGFGLVNTTVTATSGAVDVLGLGASVQVQVSAGQGVQIRSLGDLTAQQVTAGSDADLLALGSLTATVTAGNNASVLAGGPVTATVTATSGDALAFATGALTGSLTAGRDATAATLQGLQMNITAGREATALALGAITGVTISGQAEAFVRSYGSLSSVQVSSSQGDATAITNGPASNTTVSAGTQALLASVGGRVTGASITAGGRASVLGLGVTGLQAASAGDLNVLSYGPLDLSFTAGGDALLQSSGAVTTTGSTGHDLRLYTYGTLGGTLTAGDDLTAVALGSSTATLQAADNVDLVVTYDALLGSVIAGTAGNPAGDADPADGYGHMRRVYVWNAPDGTLTAFDTIGEVYVGGTLGPNASLNAPHIGLVAVHDRSPFVEDPMPVVVRLGEVVALTRDAYQQLLDLAQDFLAARTEVQAVAAATTADVTAVVQQAIDQLLRLRTEGQNTLADIGVQVQLARAEAEAKLGQALDAAAVALEAARREAQDAAGHARDALSQERAALLGEATARLKDALDDRDFTVSEAMQLAGRMGILQTNQLAQAAWMQTVHSATFVATFIEKLAEYAVDKVQDELEKIGLVALFIPGVGPIIGAVANGLNAAIYLARGKKLEASFSVFAMIPFGSILKKTGVASAASKLGALALQQAGRGLVAVAKFVRLPALAQAAKNRKCPILRVITFGKRGCFEEGTRAVVGEEWVAVVLPVADELAHLVPASFPAEDAAADWDRLCLVLLVGALGLTLGGWLLLERRGRRAAELAGADAVWLDAEDWLGRKETDADWEAMLVELARGRLGLRESGARA